MDKLTKYKLNRGCSLNDMHILYDLGTRSKKDANLRSLFKCRLGEIDDVRAEFIKNHNAIVGILLSTPDENPNAEEAIREGFLHEYFATKAIADDMFNDDSDLLRRNSIANVTAINNSNIRLPKINLIQFSGDYKDFDAYIDLFNALVHTNTGISDVEKFNHLKSSLNGQPLSLIRNLKITNDNYFIAYDTIVKRYSNKRLKAKAHWDAISDTQKIRSGDEGSLRKLLDVFSENLSALKTMGFPTSEWDFILVMTLMKRLDQDIITLFEQLEHKSNEVPKFKILFNFLENQCIALSNVLDGNSPLPFARSSNKTTTFKTNNSGRPHQNNFGKSVSTFFTHKSPSNTCAFCRANHSMYTCTAFAAKSPPERYSFCKASHLCFNCLSSSHDVKSCRSSYGCKKCSSKTHHTLLHLERKPVLENNVDTQDEIVRNQPSTSRQASNSFVGQGLVSDTSHILLATARVSISDYKGHYHQLRCLIDSGSMTSFISEKAASRLKLPQSAISLDIRGLDSMSSTVESASITFCCKPVHTPSPILQVDAVIVNKICDQLPCTPVCTKEWNHVNNLCLADPLFAKPGNIDVLLGADIFSKIILNGRITSNEDNIPDAINTIFGYVILGKTSSQFAKPIPSNFLCNFVQNSSLSDTLTKFWESENVPEVCRKQIDGKLQEVGYDECEKIFVETFARTENGNYVVSLPFNDQNCLPTFSGMRDLALSRFYWLERRLLKNEKLRILYCDFLKEYLELGHMELIQEEKIPSETYYMPHHAVFKENSPTTKLRVVFNASAHLPNQPSLNDCLLVGPKLQQDLLSILLFFRLHPFAICADIKQMYRMIMLATSHQNFQRIVWRFTPKEPIRDYRLTRVTYGVKSAPYLALRVILQLVKDEGDSFPFAAHALLNFCYVDDIVMSCSSHEIAQQCTSELIKIMEKGGFELRKWSSNDLSLLSDLPDSHLSKNPLNFSDALDTSLKVLGLQWDPVHDCFSFSIQPKIDVKCTKRTLLSELAKIYDPLGFIAPITFYCKYLIQQLWLSHCDWDDIPGEHIAQSWKKYQSDLTFLEHFKIPRFYAHAFSTQPCKYQLHGFCDASPKGYGCVIYFRMLDDNGNIRTNLVCAKSKIAPVKQLTIPRLELSAAVLLTKLICYVKKCFETVLIFERVTAWSDSQIVLHWLNGSPSKWKSFVSHRVAYIQPLLPINCWNYVNSRDNPADLACRGILPSELIKNTQWLNGAPFLLQPESEWLNFFPPPINSTSPEEITFSLFSVVSGEHLFEILLKRYSSFSTLRNVVAYLLRVFYNGKNLTNKRAGPLTSEEIQSALFILVKYTQQVHFKEEIDSKRFSKPLRKLQVFVDENGLLRVGGRLKHSSLSYDVKHPMLLPRSSELTRLIIRHFHEKFFHTSFRSTYYLVSQHFWILCPKRAINSVISKCIRCWKVTPRSYQPPMADLPATRISQIKPFSRSAVDFGGPFNIVMSRYRGVRTCKAYLCIFVCFATKAVHLELATDLSSETFLAALQRFIARRGRISHIHSDCGTNFLGASRELIRLMEQACATETITWHPSPAGAPHFNGLVEAGVKSVKKHLCHVIGDQILTYEEFNTALTLIESVLNSRPLIPLSSDVEDIQALTPGHFLTMEPVSALPMPNYTEVPFKKLSRWQLLQKLHQDFWRRWQSEYLHTLQQRSKWLNFEKTPDIGTLVLIKADNLPPTQWMLGRISELFYGNDKIARVAAVKTVNGILKRPLVKLCPLPVE